MALMIRSLPAILLGKYVSEIMSYIVLPDALVEDLAAKKDIRFYLNQPYLDLSGSKPMLVATNGHLLVAAPVEVSGDVPQGPIPIEAIKRVRKTTGKDTGLNRLVFKDGMCGNGKVMFERPYMDCKFPAWRTLVPKFKKGVAPDITFDARYFKAMQDALAPGMKISQAGTAVFLQRDKKGDVDPRAAFRVMCKRHDDVLAVIMPMRFD